MSASATTTPLFVLLVGIVSESTQKKGDDLRAMKLGAEVAEPRPRRPSDGVNVAAGDA